VAKKRFSHVMFDPPIWDEGPSSSPDGLVMSLTVPAPEGASRSNVRSRAFRRSSDPHDQFNSYNVVHDVTRRVESYRSDTSDLTVESVIVAPYDFSMFEFSNSTGRVYADAGIPMLKEMFRRYREHTGGGDATFYVREVNLRQLEQLLLDVQPSMEVVGYALANVTGIKPLQRVEAYGQQLNQNPEVQGWVDRAEEVRALQLELQRGTQMLILRIAFDGSVTFSEFPGDATGLGVLNLLEEHIRTCSDDTSVNVRQGRRS